MNKRRKSNGRSQKSAQHYGRALSKAMAEQEKEINISNVNDIEQLMVKVGEYESQSYFMSGLKLHPTSLAKPKHQQSLDQFHQPGPIILQKKPLREQNSTQGYAFAQLIEQQSSLAYNKEFHPSEDEFRDLEHPPVFGRGMDVASENLPNSDISQKQLPRYNMYTGFSGKLNESHEDKHWPNQFTIDKGFNTLNGPKKNNFIQEYNHEYQDSIVEKEQSDIQKLSFQLGQLNLDLQARLGE